MQAINHSICDGVAGFFSRQALVAEMSALAQRNRNTNSLFFTLLAGNWHQSVITWARELATKAGGHGQYVHPHRKGRGCETIAVDRRAREPAGVEFTNGDQPGLRLARTAAARSEEPGDRSKTKVGAKIGRAKPSTKKR